MPNSEQESTYSVEPGYENHPVVFVTWFGAAAYADWTRKRLPTEQEWEKAARGIDGRRYSWGEDFSVARCNTYESELGGTTPVDRYQPAGLSPYAAAEMTGNVWEWTQSDLAEPGKERVRGEVPGITIRAWLHAPTGMAPPQVRDFYIGFRCAKSQQDFTDLPARGLAK